MNERFSKNGNNHFDVISILQHIPFFKKLKKSELREFAAIVYVRWFKKNEVIFKENEPGIGMYIIYKGVVQLFRNSELNGKEQISILIADDFLGEQSLMDELSRNVTAIALEDCCLLGIFRPDLLALIKRKPRLGNKILLTLAQLISSRLHQKDEELILIKEKLANSDIIR